MTDTDAKNDNGKTTFEMTRYQKSMFVIIAYCERKLSCLYFLIALYCSHIAKEDSDKLRLM